MNEYIESVIATVEKRDSEKPEYIQCVKEVFRSLEAVINEHPEYVEDRLTEAIVCSLILLSVLTREACVFIQV